MTPRQEQDLISQIRSSQAQYKLDELLYSELRELQGIINRSSDEIYKTIAKKANKITVFQERRANELLQEFDKLSLSTQDLISGGITDIGRSSQALALSEFNDIVSWGGRAAGFNFVALSGSQVNSLLKTPIGGNLLSDWVGNTFKGVSVKIKDEISKGMFQGEGYRPLTKRLKSELKNITEREAITLARTYTQTINNKAMGYIYRENKDIIKELKWSSALEPGSRKTGRGTCLRCAMLDGQVYKIGNEPPCPLHPNCRCVLVAITKSWRDLGLDIDEIEDVKRPYTIRGKMSEDDILNLKNIDMGGKRAIIESGFHKGDYSSWLDKQSSPIKEMVLGKGRKELIDNGSIVYKDLINKNTGDLFLLKDLKKL